MDLQPHIEDFAVWLKGIGRADGTLTHHRASLRLWGKYLDAQGVTELAQVTPQLVAGYQAWLYQARSRFGQPYTLQSQIGILNSLQVFCRHLVRCGKLLHNPAETIRLPKEPKKLPGQIFTPQEVKKLLNQPDTSTVLGFRDRTLYELLYSTGLRITEAIRLQVQDIDFDQRTVAVRDGKGGKDRIVPLGATARRHLAEYLQRVRPVLGHLHPSERVFLNRCGRPFGKSGLLKKLQLYAARARIKKHVTVHTFRHTLATEMLRRGADLRQIQELLGHAKLRTTQIYTHIVKGELKRVQAHCHPREQTELPENFVKYRGRKYLTETERRR
jgi:integrase/recombinase XerD